MKEIQIYLFGITQVFNTIIFSSVALGNAEIATKAMRQLLGEESVYSLFSKTPRGQSILESIGLVPSPAILTDQVLSFQFKQRLISVFQYRQSELLAEKLVPRLQEAQKLFLDQTSQLQTGDDLIRQKIINEISEKTFRSVEKDADFESALKLAKRPILRHKKGAFKLKAEREMRPFDSVRALVLSREAQASQINVDPTLTTPEEVVLVERGGLIQRLKLDLQTLRLFRLKGIDLKVVRLMAQGVIPSLRTNPTLFTSEEVWLFRKVVGAMGGYNSYTKFLSKMQVFAETIRPELYSKLNTSEDAILAARELMDEKINISAYIAKRIEITKELNIDKYFDPIVWQVEEEMLSTLATCRRLGQFNEAADSGFGPIELMEYNTQYLRNRVFTLKTKITAAQNRALEIKALKIKTDSEQAELKQLEMDQITFEIDSRDLTQQLFRLQRASNFQKLYWEFTQNYEALIWGNLHEGQLANLRVKPIDLPEPFLIQKEVFEGKWASLYKRSLINSTDPLVAEELITLFKTLLGNARLIYKDLNRLTAGKFGETDLGKQLNQYQESLPRVLLKRTLTWGTPATILTEEVLRRWLFTEEDTKENDKEPEKLTTNHGSEESPPSPSEETTPEGR